MDAGLGRRRRDRSDASPEVDVEEEGGGTGADLCRPHVAAALHTTPHPYGTDTTSSMSFANIEVSADGARGTITLNRPDKLNSLSTETLSELIDAAHWLDEQSEVKVVVLSGNGRAFSAGADLALFSGEDSGVAARRKAADAGWQMAEAIEAMRAITIARIHGHCVGGAVLLAAACDLRVAADTTRFSIPELQLGIPLAWGGIPRLVREIGPAMTKELVLTGRPFAAEEARDLGLVNRVVGEQFLDETIEELAAQLVERSALTLAATKLAVNATSRAIASTSGAWSDADMLLTALSDPESRRVADDYLKRLERR
jgi:enoyl-CoA hydratase/carnithine racemase